MKATVPSFKQKLFTQYSNAGNNKRVMKVPDRKIACPGYTWSMKNGNSFEVFRADKAVTLPKKTAVRLHYIISKMR